MPKFPAPPRPLTAAPDVVRLKPGHLLWRISFLKGIPPATWSDFRFFGPTHARFDPRLQTRGILYAADAPLTCLAEVFQATRTIDRASGAPWLAGFELRRAVDLLSLCGAWPTRAGASMALNTGPRPRARPWAQAIYAAYPRLQGLRYPSSMHANRSAAALFERARAALPAAPAFHRALADPALLPRLSAAAARIGYRLV
ncbi:MAG: RES family NAD+ phosphorylase [Planctomycetes bacterium]|nr:RES family NAD+ phosphorylase [Planctomycetota bacterium]